MGRAPSKELQDFMAAYEIDSDEIWEVHGSTWVIKHKALERAAAKAGIVWDRPAMIETSADKNTAVICVFGKLGERVEWSIGEASPANYRVTGKMAAYPYAMAEKRGKDRVILKLLNAHGSLYSEAEADEFTQPRQNPHVNRAADFYDDISNDIPEERVSQKMKVKDARPEFAALVKEMHRIQDPEELREWGEAKASTINSMPGEWPTMFRGEYTRHKQSLTNGKAA
jgi:hypothetical protein